MIKLIRQGAYYMEGHMVKESQAFMTSDKKAAAIKRTVTYSVLKSHGGEGSVKADGLVSREGAFLTAVQVARACDLPSFSIPVYAGGRAPFLALAAKKYGCAFVPARLADLDDYLLECVGRSGSLYFATDPRMSMGALGVLLPHIGMKDAVRALGGESIALPLKGVIAVHLRGKLRRGVGPVDVALSLAKATENGFAEGKILEVIGSGVSNLSFDYRHAIDRALYRSKCLATIWQTDDGTRAFLSDRGREGDFRPLEPVQPAYYDGAITVDLARIEPMIELPNGTCLALSELQTVAEEVFKDDPRFQVRDGKVFASDGRMTGTYEDLAEAAEIVRGKNTGMFALTVRASLPALRSLAESGSLTALYGAGITSGGRPFGAISTDVGRGKGCVMDVRSLAATAVNGGEITSALDFEYPKRLKKFRFEPSVFAGVSRGTGKFDETVTLNDCSDGGMKFAPLGKHLLLKIATHVPNFVFGPDFGPVGPHCPEKEVQGMFGGEQRKEIVEKELEKKHFTPAEGTVFGSIVFTGKTASGDERAALALHRFGIAATVSKEIAETYRNDLIDWGVLPFTYEKSDLADGDYLYISDIADAIRRGETRIVATLIGKRTRDIVLSLGDLTPSARFSLLRGGVLAPSNE